MSELGQVDFEIKEREQLNRWPKYEQYIKLKDKALRAYKPVIKDMIKLRHYFSNLDQNKFDDIAELLAVFVFGVEMVYRRIGLQNGSVPIEFKLGGHIYSEPFGIYASTDLIHKSYYFNVGTLDEIVQSVGKNGRLNDDRGGVKNPTVLDLFELGAVEEAAHYIFLSTKKTVPEHSFLDSPDELTEYHTQDIERRALIWKIQYAERYKPEYVDNLTNLESKVEQVRLQNVRSKQNE